MSELHENEQSATTAPFRSRCTGCGADSDAPDQVFQTGHPAFVPHSNYALLSVQCLSCETVHDVTMWLVDQQRCIAELGDPEGLRALAAAAEAEGLVDRYQDLVETYHHHFEAQHEEVEGCPVLDLSALEIAILTDRLSTPPMETLAASRGLRQAVAGRPGLQPPGVLRLGNYRCVLSFDRMPQAAYPYALHLSVGNDVVPGHLPNPELHWLLSLFFTPGEVPFLLSEPGRTVPIVHYYLPAYSPELNQC